MDPLLDDLRRVRRRLLGVRAAEAGLEGAIWAAALAIFVTAVRILLPQSLPVAAAHPTWPLTLVPIGFAAGALWRLVRGVSLHEAAAQADRAANLKERLATALEILQRAKRVRNPAPLRPLTPSVGPSGPLPGLLDERLIAQAREAADRLDVAHLPVARAFNRRLRVVLVAALVLLAGTFIPSVGGPPLPPGASVEAAGRIGRIADREAIAPALREQIEKALARLQAPGATRSDADQATAAIYRAARGAEEKRQAASGILTKIDSPEVQAMVRAAKGGDAAGAAAAADSLADKVGSEPGSGGMPLEDRERLADSLDGAAVQAKKADLAALAAAMERAAGTVKKPDVAAAEAMKQLAGAMTEALGDKAVGAVPALVSAVRNVRQDLGLPDLPPAGPAEGQSNPQTGNEAAAHAGENPALPSTVGAAGAGAAASIPPDVKPEDRDVVRRYFGG